MRSDLKQEVKDVSYFIEADNTLKNVLIVLSSEGNPDIVLFNPSGKFTVKELRNRNATISTPVKRFQNHTVFVTCLTYV